MINIRQLIFTSIITVSVFLANCATEKSQLTESGKFSIIKAEQDKSVMLKNTCRPVAAFMGITDNEAVVAAVKYSADTVQLFHTYVVSDGLFTKKKVRDLRFWSCAAVVATAKKTAIKSKRAQARIATLRFANETKEQAKDYDWLADTLPEALETALDKRFVFEKPDRVKTQETYILLGNSQKPDQQILKKFCERADLDMAIYGTYVFDEKSQKIKVQAEIFHAEKSAIIGKLTMESPVDTEIFANVNDLSERAVKSVFVNELKR